MPSPRFLSSANAQPQRRRGGAHTQKQPSMGLWAWAGTVLGLCSALVFFAPAAWLGYAVARASQGQVLLANATGTVWQGSARLVLTGGPDSRDSTVLADRVQWTLRPSITRGGLQALAKVQALCCSVTPTQIQFSPHWSGGRIDLQALQMHLNAELLVGLGTPWNTLNPQGQINLSSDTLSIEWTQGRPVFQGSAILNLTDMSSRLSTLRPLGDYRVNLAGGDTPSLQLQTLQGALQLSGSGQWVGSRLRFVGEASAAPDREEALSNLLNIIGRREGRRSVITLG